MDIAPYDVFFRVHLANLDNAGFIGGFAVLYYVLEQRTVIRVNELYEVPFSVSRHSDVFRRDEDSLVAVIKVDMKQYGTAPELFYGIYKILPFIAH